MLNRDQLRAVFNWLPAGTTLSSRARIVAALLLGAVALACGPARSPGSGEPKSPQAAAPSFNPRSGANSTTSLAVTISSTTPNATIHCTTDGTPVSASSPTCSSVTVTQSTTINAIATATGYTPSEAAAASYTIGSTPSSTIWVMGYVPLWLISEGTFAAPEGIDYSAMTHMIFCLLNVSDTGEISGAVNSMRAIPGSVAGPYTANGTTYLSIEDAYVGEAHKKGTKALLVIGGNGDSAAIGAAVAAGKGDVLVKNVVDHMVALDFDGIDINWENSTPNDVTVVRDFVAAFRTETAKRSRYATTPAIITYTWGSVAAAPWFDNSYDFALASAAIAGGADRLNVMTYALDNMNWIETTWGFSNLFNTAVDPNLHSTYVSYGAGAYADHGVSKDKINVGIGLYPARYASFKPWKASTAYTSGAKVVSGFAVYRANAAGTSGSTKPKGFGSSVSDGKVSWTYLGQLGPGYPIADTVDTSKSGDGDDYRNGTVWAYAGQGTRFFDSETANSYLLFPDDDQARGYISWEDPRALAAKAHFVRANGFGGAIVWTTSYGNVGTSGYDNPFMDAIKKHFLGAMPADVRVTPAPASVAPNGKLTFTATVADAANEAVTWSVVEGTAGGTIDGSGSYTAPAQPGVYHVRATSVEQTDIFADSAVTVK